MEGFIDRYGMPVLDTPETEVVGVDAENIYQGSIDYWKNEVESLTADPDALNEFYRQFPRTESHAETKASSHYLILLNYINK